MKKIVISIGMAVVTGVLLLGVNGAFGLTAPTQDPATAGNVGPTFSDVTVANPGKLSFGNSVRQMINLWSTEYGIGVQAGTTYFRSSGDFQFYKGGTHSTTRGDAGTGGTAQLTIKDTGNVGIGTGTVGPVAKLDVVATGDNAKVLRLGTDRPWCLMQSGTGSTTALKLSSDCGDTNNNKNFIIDTTGNVGIGTPTPGEKLTVMGTIGVTGTISNPSAALLLEDDTVIQKDIDANASSAPLIVRRVSGGTWIGISNSEIRAEGTALYLNYDSTGQDVVVGNGADYGSDKTNLDVRGAIFNGSTGSAALVLDDTTVIQSAVDAGSSGAALILRSSATDTSWIGIDENEILAQGTPLYLNNDSGQDVVVGDGSTHGGDLTDLDVKGTLKNTSTYVVGGVTFQNDLKIDDGLELTGHLENPSTNNNGAVKIADDLHITGFISNPEINSSTNPPTDVAVKFSDNLAIIGGIVLSGGIVAGDSIATTESLTAYKNLNVGIDADLRGSVFNGDSKPLNLADDVSVAGTLSVTGKLRAGTLGTYTEVSSSPTTLTDGNSDTSAGAVGSATAACAAPAVIVSCSGRISEVNTSTHDATAFGNLSAVEVRFASNTCYVDGHTTSGATRYLFAKALCFNPSI